MKTFRNKLQYIKLQSCSFSVSKCSQVPAFYQYFPLSAFQTSASCGWGFQCLLPERIQSANVPPSFVFLSFSFSYTSLVRCFLRRDLLSPPLSFPHRSASSDIFPCVLLLPLWLLDCEAKSLQYFLYIAVRFVWCLRFVTLAVRDCNERFHWLTGPTTTPRTICHCTVYLVDPIDTRF